MRHDFSPLSLKGLSKAGDIVLPGGEGFPRFSETEFIKHFGRIAYYMNQDDREGFKLLTAMMGVMPSFIVRFILWMATMNHLFPGPLGAVLRQINMGVRGVLFTMYYSGVDGPGKRVLKQLNYNTCINTPYTEDTEMETLLTQNNPLNSPMMFQNSHENPGPTEAAAIFDKARSTYPAIAALTVKERLGFITKLRETILHRQEEIVDVVQKETHKARTDVLISELFPLFEHLEFLEHEAEKALRPEKIATPTSMMGKSSNVWFEPLGTILVISPWNYPFYQAIVPITCSFITGNATVYKPSELTPLKGLVESILIDAGMKPEWVQIVYGDGKSGVELINQRPQKIFFTGSVGTGKKIMGQAAQYLIPVELELGGKDPMLAFEDVNIDRAVKGAVWGAFTNTGQSCTSIERLYVQESIYEKFKQGLVEETKKIKIGVDKDGSADMGGMISERQIKIVAELVKDAVSQGAVMLTGKDWDFQSRFIPPIILEGTNHKMRINQEEIFGPVLPLMKFKDEAHAIQLANDSTFGLSASVWTHDKERALRVASKIVTGNISINNVMLSEGNHALPFGGVKDSGIGRYKGVHGLRSFCNMKSVLADSDSKKIEANWYPYTPLKYTLFTGLTQALFSMGLKKWVGLVRFGLPLESHAQKAKRD
ncbi:MAG TPA: aldehyde dehydrogenase family protein [Bacteriovoracaceae bacterium]|nr:aldehyde dehydrogenase family protein [Bacteriovoracaceae bacterium]